MRRHVRLIQRASVTGPLIGLGIFSLGCVAKSGCEGDRCRTAVIASTADADILLPPVTMQNVGVAVSDLLFLKLADIGPGLNTVGDEGFLPRLAISWEFEDATTIAFTINPEARWEDGIPVSAADVVFTFDVYTDTTVASAVADRLETISSVLARDENTVVFTFTRPYPEQFYDATHYMRIIPEHILGSVSRREIRSNEFGRQPVGNGPYRLRTWRRDQFIELTANPDFFLGAPAIERVIWRISGDLEAVVNQLVVGEADITETILNPAHLERISKVDNLVRIVYPAPVYGYFGFNFRNPDSLEDAHPLFGDVKMRLAIAAAIDPDVIVDAVFAGNASVPVGATGRAVWIWSDEITRTPTDTAAASAALSDLGWNDSDGDGILDRDGTDLEFEFLVPSSSGARRQAAVIMQDQLRQVGVRMNIAELEFNTFIEYALAGNFDALFGAFALDPSPRGIQQLWTGGAGGNNWGGYSNLEVDRLVAEALEATSESEARRMWHAVLQALNDDVAAIWIFEPQMTAIVNDRFENVSIRPDQWAADIWRWRVR